MNDGVAVEHGRRIGAAENLPRALRVLVSAIDLDQILALQQADHGIDIDDRVDLAAAHGGNRARRGADADERGVVRRKAVLTMKYCTMKCVPEPGAVTPIFMPLRSFGSW